MKGNLCTTTINTYPTNCIIFTNSQYEKLLDHRCGSAGTTVSSGNKRSQENRRLEQEALALQAKNKSYALLESDDEGAGQLQVKPSKHKKSKKEKKSKREKHRYLTLPLHCK